MEERSGFLAGYLTCAHYDAGLKLGEDRWTLLEKVLSRAYADGSAPQTARVGDLAVKLGKQHPEPKAKGHDGRDTTRYGFFDGEYWRQIPADERLGFVTGYLECRRTHLPGKARYSRSPAEYVQELSRWYGVRDDDDVAIDHAHQDIKIPVALHELRDRG